MRSIGTVWRDVAAARNGTVWQGNGYARISHARARRSIDCYSDSVFDDDGDMSEVIGNIHDNPELLEVSKSD